MAINIYSVHDDLVIKGKFLTGVVTYKYAIENFYPLINRLYIQRKIQDAKFYKRLEQDLVKGCIMPPITIALIVEDEDYPSSRNKIEEYVNKNIEDAFILDGIQRLNTLKRTYDETKSKEVINGLNLERPLFVNTVLCGSMDNLLYRMITLNNGQKPMTARHQIEILANNVYDFEDTGVVMQTEKERGKRVIRGAFNKGDFIKAYLAFLSNSINIDNKKIIEEKLDELLANKILDSNITEDNLEFSEIIELIGRFSEDDFLKKWFKVSNNLIGFCVGIRDSFESLKDEPIIDFINVINEFEKAFDSYDISKIKLGRERRKLTKFLISNYDDLKSFDSDELLMKFIELD